MPESILALKARRERLARTILDAEAKLVTMPSSPNRDRLAFVLSIHKGAMTRLTRKIARRGEKVG